MGLGAVAGRAHVRAVVDGMRRQLGLILVIAGVAGAIGILLGSTGRGTFRAESEVQIRPGPVESILNQTFGIEGRPFAVQVFEIERLVANEISRRRQEGRSVDAEVKATKKDAPVVLIATAPTGSEALANELAELVVAEIRKRGTEIALAAERALQRRLRDLDGILATGDPSLRPEVSGRRQMIIEGLEAMAVARELGFESNAVIVRRASKAVPAGRGGMGAVRTGLTTFVIGLLIAAAVAVLRLSYDTIVRTASDLREMLPHVPILASIALPRYGEVGLRAQFDEPDGAVEDAFRRLRASLLALASTRKWRVLLVTGPTGGEGTTSIVANLAISFSRSGSKILVIDADHRTQALTAAFSCKRGPGLADLLLESLPVAEVVQPSEQVEGMFILSLGADNPPAPDLFGNAALPEIVEELQSDFDFILIDGAPLVTGSETLSLSHLVDATVLAVAADVTDARDLLAARDSLENLGMEVAGAVLTEVVEVHG